MAPDAVILTVLQSDGGRDARPTDAVCIASIATNPYEHLKVNLMTRTLLVFAALAAILLSPAIPTHADTPKRKIVPHNEPALITADADGALNLTAKAAELFGREGPGTIAIYDGQMCIGWWTSSEDWAQWTIEAPKAGVYDVHLHWSIPDDMAGNFFSISAGESRLINTIRTTGGFEHFHWAKYGSIQLEQGTQRIVMRALGPVKGELADIKTVRLVPAESAPPDVPGGGMSAEASLALARVPEGFELTVFAAEPMLTNPTSICVDSNGRVWVAEAAVYRFYRAAEAGRMPLVDRIKVLEDTNGDGRADKVTVFYEGLMAPMSLAVAGNRVFVAESPYLYELIDDDGDLRADRKRIVLEGFGGYNDDQALHGLTFGPDHKLYMTQGDLTFDVTGPDGRRVKHDVGAVLRCELDGTKLEVTAWDLKNPIEVTVDSFGEAWFGGNDDDGTRMCRLDFTLEGGYYGWRYWDIYRQRREVYGSGAQAHWHANEVGIVPPALITGFGAPCGQLMIEDDSLGERFRGSMLLVDPGPRVIRAFHLQPEGAAYSVRPENLILNEDDTYFRPIDAAVAPDGSVYICDWYDIGVGGHTYNDPNRGRIYRLRRTDAPRPAPIKPGPFDNDADALAALANPNLDAQFHARERLIASGQAATPELRRLLTGDDAVLAARAMWVLDRIGGEARQAVVDQLRAEDDRLRALAVRILRRHGEQYAPELLALASDPSAHVRREVLLLVRDLDSIDAERALVTLAKQWDGRDRFYLESIGIAARGRPGQANDRFPDFHGPYGTMRLSDDGRMKRLFHALVEEHKLEFGPRLIALTRLLRPHDAERYLLDTLRRGDLPPGAQALVLSSLGPNVDLDAGRQIVALLADASLPAETRRATLESLARHLPGAWRDLQDDAPLREALIAALNDDALRTAALDVVAAARPAFAVESLAEIALHPGLHESQRLRAAELLGAVARKDVNDSMRSLATSDQTSDALRSAAVESLVVMFDREALRHLLTGDEVPSSTRLQTAERLAQSMHGGLWLHELIEAGALDAALVQRVTALGLAHVDVNVRMLYLEKLPESERPQTLGATVDPADILAMQGDAARGRSIFFHSAAACSRCHMVHGQGRDVGPDLGVIGRKSGPDGLLMSILSPSAAISPDYQPSLVETDEGMSYFGFVSEDAANDLLRVKLGDGSTVTLPRSEVTRNEKRNMSLMPEQLAGAMTAQDLADLVAYLSSLREETQVVPFWWALGAFPNDNEAGWDIDFGPEADAANIDHQREFDALGGRKVRWERFETQPFQGSRGVDLQRFVAERQFRTGDLITYYAVAIDSPQAQTATLLIGSEDGVKVWLDGRLIHSHHVRRNPAQLGQDELEIDLRQGRQVLLVKLEQIGGGGGLIAALRVRHDVTFNQP